MIKITHKDSPVFQGFSNKSGLYSDPGNAVIAFGKVLEGYDYWFGPDIKTLFVSRNDLFDILQGVIRVGYAHIAWCRHPDGRYSVTGHIVVT